jgi:hypothetical protein
MLSLLALQFFVAKNCSKQESGNIFPCEKGVAGSIREMAGR